MNDKMNKQKKSTMSLNRDKNGTHLQRLRGTLHSIALALSLLAVLPHPMAAAPSSETTVSLPNGYASISADDLWVNTTAGTVKWTRHWDGQEWKFNRHWESLSQSWSNLTGSQTADTTGGTLGGQIYSGATTGSGCWVWVDENWQPSTGTVLIGGIPRSGPMQPIRTTPFNRLMGEAGNEYAPPQRVSVDYAALCAGGGGNESRPVRELEGIRRANELYLGEGGRYAFSNRSVLEKRAVGQLPAFTGATLDAQLASGRIALAPINNPKGFRWIDKSGDWIDYDTQGRVVAWGDKNNNTVWMVRDTDGVLRGVADANGRVVYSLHYTGELVTEVRDYASGSGDQGHRVRYKYDEFNRLTEVTDPRGNVTRYDYDPANRIVQVTDPEGRIEKLTYSGHSVVRRTAPDGAVTDYLFEYDDVNKQFYSKVTGPEGAGGRRIEELTHNRVGKLVRQLVNGRVEKEVRYDTGARTRIETNARGFKTRVVNDEFDQPVEIVLPDGAVQKRAYSAQHLGLTEVTDELGVKTRYEYDAAGNLLRRIEAAGTAAQRITEYVRNAIGQVVRFTNVGGTAEDGTVTQDATWTLEYDLSGQVSRATDPEGHVRQYNYDHAGNLLSSTDPRGFTTKYELDAGGYLLSVTDALGRKRTYQYDKVGNATVMTDARAKMIQASYDAMNRQLQVINAVGGVWRMQYDGRGMPVAETDEDGRTSAAEFDNLQRLSKQIDGLGNVTEYNYSVPDGSAAGTLGSLFAPTEIKYPTFSVRQRYDALERPTSETVLNPNSLGTEGLVSATEYTKRGEVKSETDANGKTRHFTYDALGQLTETTDSLGNKTRAGYDLRGNLVRITDAKGNVNRFEFDRNDRVVREILPLGQVTSYQYDGVGNVIERVSANGMRIVFAYDAGNRLSQARHYGPGNVLKRTTTYTWDAEDNLTAWNDTDHGSGLAAGASRVFDDAGRKTSETVTYPGGTTLAFGYAYSAAGNKIQLTWPDGTQIGYRYTGHDELESVDIPGEGTISASAFKWLAPTKTVLPGGVVQERTLDGLLNLEGLRVKTPTQQTVLTLANTYGKMQELKRGTRTDNADGLSGTTVSDYKYDDELRLTEAKKDTGGLFGTDTESFTLDAVGNRIAHSKVSGAWTYDANNRLIQRGTGANATTYEYDEAGNLIRKNEPGAGVTSYEYDTQHRLIQVRDSANRLVARYGYDPMDRRIWREQFRNRDGSALAQAQRTFYLYADEGLIAEATQDIALNADGTVTALGSAAMGAQYGPRPNAEFTTGVLFTKTKNSNGQVIFAYYHHDQLGTPIQATDKAGNIVWAASYNAFGLANITTPAATAESPTITSNLRFPGQIEDPETGLHYNFRRYYDPSTGRYISQDPLGAEGGNNSYRYAEADPVNLSDPTGECPMCAIYAVCVAECMLEDVAINALTGECNNFGDSAKSCAASCLGGIFGRLGKWGKRATKSKTPHFEQTSPNPSFIANQTCSPNSFPADTLVHVRPRHIEVGLQALAQRAKAELRPIGMLRVGDQVLALSDWKEEGELKGVDGRLSYETVSDIYVSQKEQILVSITFGNGKTISSTDGHPFKTTEGWRDAIQLRKGDKIISLDPDGKGDIGQVITKVRIKKTFVRVYNLEVENAHTYFVGANGTLVHNGHGSYTCTFASGMKYHGKGDYARAKKSGRDHANEYNDLLVDIDWKSEKNNRDSFKAEYERLKNDGGPGNKNNYNKIQSPGAKY